MGNYNYRMRVSCKSGHVSGGHFLERRWPPRVAAAAGGRDRRGPDDPSKPPSQPPAKSTLQTHPSKPLVFHSDFEGWFWRPFKTMGRMGRMGRAAARPPATLYARRASACNPIRSARIRQQPYTLAARSPATLCAGAPASSAARSPATLCACPAAALYACLPRVGNPIRPMGLGFRI